MKINQIFRTPVWRTFAWQAVGFACIFGLRELGVHHLGYPLLFIAALGALIVAMFWLNSDMVIYARRALNRQHLTLLLIVYCGIGLIYTVEPADMSLIAAQKNIHFAHHNFVYILTKSFDILFQQLAFAMYVYDLRHRNIPMLGIQISSAVLLSVSHAMTLLSLPDHVAVIFIVAAAVGGMVFPLVITHPKGGLIPTSLLHWSYYVGMGLAFNLLLPG